MSPKFLWALLCLFCLFLQPDLIHFCIFNFHSMLMIPHSAPIDSTSSYLPEISCGMSHRYLKLNVSHTESTLILHPPTSPLTLPPSVTWQSIHTDIWPEVENPPWPQPTHPHSLPEHLIEGQSLWFCPVNMSHTHTLLSISPYPALIIHASNLFLGHGVFQEVSLIPVLCFSKSFYTLPPKLSFQKTCFSSA